MRGANALVAYVTTSVQQHLQGSYDPFDGVREPVACRPHCGPVSCTASTRNYGHRQGTPVWDPLKRLDAKCRCGVLESYTSSWVFTSAISMYAASAKTTTENVVQRWRFTDPGPTQCGILGCKLTL